MTFATTMKHYDVDCRGSSTPIRVASVLGHSKRDYCSANGSASIVARPCVQRYASCPGSLSRLLGDCLTQNALSTAYIGITTASCRLGSSPLPEYSTVHDCQTSIPTCEISVELTSKSILETNFQRRILSQLAVHLLVLRGLCVARSHAYNHSRQNASDRPLYSLGGDDCSCVWREQPVRYRTTRFSRQSSAQYKRVAVFASLAQPINDHRPHQLPTTQNDLGTLWQYSVSRSKSVF